MTIRIVNRKVINPEGVELNAVLHCNMRCRSCSHLAPLFTRSVADPTATYDTLSVLARSYHASFTKILGGEPLLHPDILDLIQAVRASQVSDTVLVCTNGTLLGQAPAAFWQAVDAVEISVYPSRALAPSEIRGFHALASEHGVDLTVNFYGHFRVAYSEQGTGCRTLIERIFRTCKLAHYWLSHTVYEGWLYRCPQSVFLPKQLQGARWDATVDGIAIESDPGFVERLFAFLSASTPLRACQHCLGSVGTLHPHVELQRSQWRQCATTEEVVDYPFLALAEEDITVDDGCVRSTRPV